MAFVNATMQRSDEVRRDPRNVGMDGPEVEETCKKQLSIYAEVATNVFAEVCSFMVKRNAEVWPWIKVVYVIGGGPSDDEHIKEYITKKINFNVGLQENHFDLLLVHKHQCVERLRECNGDVDVILTVNVRDFFTLKVLIDASKKALACDGLLAEISISRATEMLLWWFSGYKKDNDDEHYLVVDVEMSNKDILQESHLGKKSLTFHGSKCTS